MGQLLETIRQLLKTLNIELGVNPTVLKPGIQTDAGMRVSTAAKGWKPV